MTYPVRWIVRAAKRAALTAPFAVLVIVAFELPGAGPGAVAQTRSPVTINGVFDPDLADVKPDAIGKLRDAAKNAQSDCYPPRATFSVVYRDTGDPSFDESLAKARADALAAALPSLGLEPGQFKAEMVVGGSDAVRVNYDKFNDVDNEPPKIRVSSTPAKGAKVKPGDKITVTIIASERYQDGHQSWPTGVKALQIREATAGLLDSKDYGLVPPPCTRQTLEVTYTVPADPPAIIKLIAHAEDGGGRGIEEEGDFPTVGDYFGTLVFSSTQQVPAGTQFFDGSFDITLTRDAKGNLSGAVAGTQSERLAVASCPSDTTTPGRMSAKLDGVLKDGGVISLDVTNGTFIPPDMTPCLGGQPGKSAGAYAWPHFALVFLDLEPAADGSYAFGQQWTNLGGGFPYTERYDLRLAPAK